MVPRKATILALAEDGGDDVVIGQVGATNPRVVGDEDVALVEGLFR